MKQVLKTLMALQKLDTQLGEIVSLRGDLPQQVKALTQELEAAQKAVSDVEDKQKICQVEKDERNLEVKALNDKKEKYQKQLYDVKNNREYDAVTMEMEQVRILSEEHETRLIQIMDEEADLSKIHEEKTAGLEKIRAAFDEKRRALEEAIGRTETEEVALRSEREKLVGGLEKRILNNYNRILNAKNGQAVVPVLKTACGGCYTNLPPQRVLEVRQMKYLKMCENCGRILVWDEEVSAEGV